MTVRRTHIVIPEDLATEIDSLVGKRKRSQFLTRAAWTEVRRLQALSALEHAAGSWNDSDHPELRRGAADWVRKLRRQEDRRLGRRTKR